MAMLIDEKTAGVNKDKCIKMAIVHDLAESLVGDITPYDGVTVEDKHTQERVCHILFLSAAVRSTQSCEILHTGIHRSDLKFGELMGASSFCGVYFSFYC